MDPQEHRALAAALRAAHRGGRRFEPLRHGGQPLALEDAYRVQAVHVELLRDELGADVAGYKIGLTSAAMQAMCGIAHPVYGCILDARVRAGAGAAALRQHVHLGIEFEIAARLGSDFAAEGAEPTREDAAAHVDAVAAALELVDDRHADYARLDAASLVADNAWNAGIVLAPWQPVPADLAGRRGTLRIDGVLEEEGSVGTGGADPLASVAWLARELGRRGGRLRRGDVVMTGSVVRTRFPPGAARWSFGVDGLGTVDLRIVP